MKKALPASQGAEFGDGDSQREPVLLSAETVSGVDPTILSTGTGSCGQGGESCEPIQRCKVPTGERRFESFSGSSGLDRLTVGHPA